MLPAALCSGMYGRSGIYGSAAFTCGDCHVSVTTPAALRYTAQFACPAFVSKRTFHVRFCGSPMG